ncbi:afadin- and alpha-actinin-binding protein-like [Cololabis saira]|uniref:afadin- and alpha-actinin-binding protein-like n=1 Tax=Cololabis saira TaxID=129043 RepID=UPI002AD23D72|nr:afadin- and alpha-actinin-binding protein-like [Cololabis saira]XP_061594358.1 afadin- and alpha-actinin-binding protein-like [Cololabis saira]
MPESSLVKGVHGSTVECGTPLLRQFNQSTLPLLRNSNVLSTFCTENNMQECLSHINQEMTLLGLPPVWTISGSSSDLNIVAVLNCMYDLIQLHRRGLRTLENMEVEQLRSSSNVDFLQLTNTSLKEQLEHSKRENTGLLERERQLQLKVKSLQNSLKNEKEEVQKLQNIIVSRASQYNHDMKRKEREFNKLKERLNQLLADKKERKQAIDVLNNIGRADGKRSLWRTEKTEAKQEGEMYKILLSDYDARQRELVMENAELRKVLQQMKRDMVSILNLRKAVKDDQHEHSGTQGSSEEEEEEGFDSSKEGAELYCIHAREKLTNSIRLQWRRLKSHVERLNSQVSLPQIVDSINSDAAPRETHEEEMERLKLEIQQCKDFIQTQQQLLQQQLSSPCDEETGSLLNDSYMLQGNARLREDWKTFEEQRKIFDRERRNFTEAAIRLSHERKAFEEDRATWLKHQFLTLSPFGESKKPSLSKSISAFGISETEVSQQLGPEKLSESFSNSAPPTPGCLPLMSSLKADQHHALSFIPQSSSIKPKKKTENAEESSIPSGHVPVQHELRNNSSHSFILQNNSSI